MRWLIKAFWYFVALICLAGRIIYAAGQTYFGMKSTTDYMKAAPQVSTAINLTAVTTTAISTLIGKTPAALAHLGPTSRSDRHAAPAAARPPLGWTAWIFKKTIDGSGFFYGVTNSIAGYFSTLVLGDATGLNSKTWKASFQGTGATVAVTSLASYYSYDFKRICENSEQMARALDERSIPGNRPMAYTLGVAFAIVPTYVGQAYFWARPSIVALPYAETVLHDAGINLGVILACATTFFTVIGWMPSVYNHFAGKDREQERVAIPPTFGSSLLRSAAYFSGVGDSLGGNGMGPFISMIVMLNSLFGWNPYGWMIGYAAVCGVNAAITNMMFSVLPGLDDAEQMIYRPRPAAVVSDVEAPLLPEEAGQRRYGTADAPTRPFRSASQSGLLTFTAPKQEERPVVHAEATAEPPKLNIRMEN